MLSMLAQIDPNQDLWPLIQEAAAILMSSGMSGSVKIAVLLMVAISLVRKVLGPKVAFLRSDLGAVILTVGVGMAAAVANALIAGSVLSWGVLGAAFTLSLQAAGGYTMLKKSLLPVLVALEGKLPNSMSWIFKLVTLSFGMFGIEATKKAMEAGAAAVEANPPGGVGAIVGEPRNG